MSKRLFCLAIAFIFILTASGAAFADEPFRIDINEADVTTTNQGVPRNNTLDWWEIHGAEVIDCEYIPGELVLDPSTDSVTVVTESGARVKSGSGKSRPNRTYNIVLSEGTDPDGTVYMKYKISLPSSGKVPVIATESLDYIEINNQNNENGMPIKLTNGTGSQTFIVYYTTASATPRPLTVTHTFNFTVAEPDVAEDPDPSEVDSIAVTTSPRKTRYFVGDVFNKFGMEVTATLTEAAGGGTRAIVGYVVPNEPFAEPGDHLVTVTYGAHQATTPVTVLQSLALGGLEVTNGQRFGDYTLPQSFYNLNGPQKKPDTQIDAVIWHGQDKGRFSFAVPDGVTVSIGSTPQTVAEDQDTGERLCELALSTSLTGTKTTVRLTDDENNFKDYDFTCYSQKYSGMPNGVTDFLSIASQYTNGSGSGPYGIIPVGTLHGLEVSTQTIGSNLEVESSPVSLGNFGGYITYWYKDAITDNPKNPYGIDFIVYGNSYDGSNAFAEPGNVYVSEDGETWYTLAGSWHYDDNALWPYSMTYTRTSAGKSTWTDSLGRSGAGDHYPRKEFYPLFGWTPETEQKITLHGVWLAPGSAKDEHGNTLPPYPHFGYADVAYVADDDASNAALNPYTGISYREFPLGRWYPANDRYDEFDLKWAVDCDTGQPVPLPDGIHFVKIQTASNIGSGGGGNGEKSTEIHMMRVAEPAGTEVGTTPAPASITIGDTTFNRSDLNAVNNVYSVTVGKVFPVNVETEAENVYINGTRVNSVNSAALVFQMPNRKMLRVIAQGGEKEPWIGYFNLTDDGMDDDAYSVITFDPAGGLITDGLGLERVYMLGQGIVEFPEPARYGHDFRGWFDEEGNEYKEYNEAMPRTLTLTARWKYNAPADNSGAGYGSVLTYEGDWPDIDLPENSKVTVPVSVRGLLNTDPYAGATEDMEEEGIYTYGAITKLLKAAKQDDVTGVYVTESSKVFKGMDIAAKEALNAAAVKVLELPLVAVVTQNPGDTVLIPHKVTFGEAFVGTKLSSVVPLKLNAEGKTIPLGWQPDPTKIEAGQYAWTDADGEKITADTEIVKDHELYLNVAVTDGSALDWDEDTEKSLLDPVILTASAGSGANTTTPAAGGGYEPGGGCDTGLLGLAAIGALAALAAARKRGKR